MNSTKPWVSIALYLTLSLPLNGCVGESRQESNDLNPTNVNNTNTSSSNTNTSSNPTSFSTNSTQTSPSSNTNTSTPTNTSVTTVMNDLPECSDTEFWPISSPLRRLTDIEMLKTMETIFYGNQGSVYARMNWDILSNSYIKGIVENNYLQRDKPSSSWVHDSFINVAENQGPNSTSIPLYNSFARRMTFGSNPSETGGVGYKITDRRAMYGGTYSVDFYEPVRTTRRTLPGWSPCTEQEANADEQGCGQRIVREVIPRLIRRPFADSQEQQDYESLLRVAIEEEGYNEGIKRFFQVVLQSTDVIYRPEYGNGNIVHQGQAVELTDFELATRLSYFLWQSPPDDELWQAATRGELRTDEQLRAQVKRMLFKDNGEPRPKAKASIRDFFRGWLKLDKFDASPARVRRSITENGNQRPYEAHAPIVEYMTSRGIAPSYAPEGPLFKALRTSLELYLDWAFWEADSWDALMSGDQFFTNHIISGVNVYDLPEVPLHYDESQVNMIARDDMRRDYKVWLQYDPAGFRRVQAPPSRRGVLMHPAVLALASERDKHNPTLRGLQVLTAFLCAEIPTPDDMTPPATGQPPGEPCTTREKVNHSHSYGSCVGCHVAIDGFGFVLENFDAIGVEVDREPDCASKPIDSTSNVDAIPGYIPGGSSTFIKRYTTTQDLVDTLSQSQQVKACMTSHWMRYALGRHETSSFNLTMPIKERKRRKNCEESQVNALVRDMDDNNGSLQELVTSLILSPSFRTKALDTSTQGDAQ